MQFMSGLMDVANYHHYPKKPDGFGSRMAYRHIADGCYSRMGVGELQGLIMETLGWCMRMSQWIWSIQHSHTGWNTASYRRKRNKIAHVAEAPNSIDTADSVEKAESRRKPGSHPGESVQTGA